LGTRFPFGVMPLRALVGMNGAITGCSRYKRAAPKLKGLGKAPKKSRLQSLKRNKTKVMNLPGGGKG